jgi:hypothetical protein
MIPTTQVILIFMDNQSSSPKSFGREIRQPIGVTIGAVGCSRREVAKVAAVPLMPYGLVLYGRVPFGLVRARAMPAWRAHVKMFTGSHAPLFT